MTRTVERSSAEFERTIAELLQAPAETIRMRSHGSTIAAVLIPIYVTEDDLVTVLTRRHTDLRRHAGEISFPGGRRDTGEDLRQTALREAEEEIALPREAVELIGALPPTSTFVTNYCVYPFVGMIDAELELVANPAEVDAVVELGLRELAAGYERKRLVRRGVPIKTDTYTVGEDLIWGATARILGMLIQRLEPLLDLPGRPRPPDAGPRNTDDQP